MAKKEPKKGAKKNKKGKGKKPKVLKKTGKPTKKGAKGAKLKAPVKQAVAPRPAQQAHFDPTTVMVTESFRRRVCDALDFTPRQRGYLTKTVLSIWRAASGMQADAIGHSDCYLTVSRLGENGAIDLSSLQHVAVDVPAQDDIRRMRGRSAYIGPESIRLLGSFVVMAERVARAELDAVAS